MLALVLAGGAGILAGGSSFPALSLLWQGGFADALEQYASRGFPSRDGFRNMAISLKLMMGQTQQDGVYIAQDMLVEALPPVDEGRIRENLNQVLAFGQKSSIPVYLMLIPTKCAIKQQELPEYVQLFNQKSFIEEAYREASGKLSTIDVYPILFSNQEDYIYYKTAPDLTVLGAYHVYSVAAARMNLDAKEFSQFQIQHVRHDFYGETYESSPYKDITPDTISVSRYYYDGRERDVSVRHEQDGQAWYYSQLYPLHLAWSENPLDINLGGNTGDFTIQVLDSPYPRRLLVFGDDSILPVLPFLAIHYEEVRFVDLSRLGPEEIYQIDVNYYDHVLLGYSMETFTQTDAPARLQYS